VSSLGFKKWNYEFVTFQFGFNPSTTQVILLYITIVCFLRMDLDNSLRTGGDGIINMENPVAPPIAPEEEINMAEIALLAQYDDSELDRFLLEN